MVVYITEKVMESTELFFDQCAQRSAQLFNEPDSTEMTNEGTYWNYFQN